MTSVVASKLREFLSLSRTSSAQLTVKGGEVVLDARLPPAQLINKGCKVTYYYNCKGGKMCELWTAATEFL